jgi:hypothetical protein
LDAFEVIYSLIDKTGPKQIIVDFEVAACMAIRKVFKTTKIYY